MPLYFITGNANKFQEAKAILGNTGIEQTDLDLPEIQSLDPREIVKAKLLEALKRREGELILEDTSLRMECLNGLPGPLIKWFLKSIGREGLSLLAEKMGNSRAEAVCVFGYASPKGMHFFEGSVKGKIVSPRGVSDFGWDPIFQPDGFSKTFAEMTKEEKNKISHRGIALRKLRQFLEK